MNRYNIATCSVSIERWRYISCRVTLFASPDYPMQRLPCQTDHRNRGKRKCDICLGEEEYEKERNRTKAN